jgi:hypothetical protein
LPFLATPNFERSLFAATSRRRRALCPHKNVRSPAPLSAIGLFAQIKRSAPVEHPVRLSPQQTQEPAHEPICNQLLSLTTVARQHHSCNWTTLPCFLCCPTDFSRRSNRLNPTCCRPVTQVLKSGEIC